MEIVYSDDFKLINLKVSKLTKSLNKQITKLSFIENSLDQIERAISTIDLFNRDKRVFVLQDAYFLTNNKIKLHESFHPERFWSLATRLNQNITLIVTVPSAKILKKWPDTIEPSLHELKKITRPELARYLKRKLNPKLAEDALNYFLDNFEFANLHQIDNELEKLNHLFSAREVISLEQLKFNLVSPINFDIFKMSSSFIAGDLLEFLKCWHYGFNHETNGQQLFGLLSKQLITLHWYQRYRELGWSDINIAKHLDVNPYYLKKLVATNQQHLDQINDRIIYIYDLIKNIWLGRIDKKIMPEYFFLKMFL